MGGEDIEGLWRVGVLSKGAIDIQKVESQLRHIAALAAVVFDGFAYISHLT